MALFGDPEANSLARLVAEVGFLACSLAVRYIHREYVRQPGLTDIPPRSIDCGAGSTFSGPFRFTNSVHPTHVTRSINLRPGIWYNL
jgi:hypothetical protein